MRRASRLSLLSVRFAGATGPHLAPIMCHRYHSHKMVMGDWHLSAQRENVHGKVVPHRETTHKLQGTLTSQANRKQSPLVLQQAGTVQTQPEGGSVGEATSSCGGASWLDGTWPSCGAMLTQVDTQAKVPRVLNPSWPQVLFCGP